jgi:NAD(P)-dependent dehydrogenase (short-subunit alcohol dehydrogenase family)
MDLLGRTAMVTGAGRGIGRAIALTLASRGADIAAADIAATSLDLVSEEVIAIGSRCLPVEMNVASSASVAAGVSRVVEHFGGIDILVNNAGMLGSSLLADLEEEAWDSLIGVNTKGVWLCTKAVVPYMKRARWGRVINISSIAAKTGEYANGAYCISKAAVSMMTQVWALELAEYGINVNAVCPGYTDTEMMRFCFDSRGPLEGMTPAEYERALLSNVPLGRMAKPTEIAELVAFLASDNAGYITGTAVVIAGGKELH